MGKRWKGAEGKIVEWGERAIVAEWKKEYRIKKMREGWAWE